MNHSPVKCNILEDLEPAEENVYSKYNINQLIPPANTIKITKGLRLGQQGLNTGLHNKVKARQKQGLHNKVKARQKQGLHNKVKARQKQGFVNY